MASVYPPDIRPRQPSLTQTPTLADRRFVVDCDVGGAERDRTVDLLNAIQALSQLSYSPAIVNFSASALP